MENGIFRYSLDDVATRIIPGRYGFVIQVNASGLAFIYAIFSAVQGGPLVVCLLVSSQYYTLQLLDKERFP